MTDENTVAASAVIQDCRKPIPPQDWEWFGYAAHLCVSNRCTFHLATRVEDVIVSTVGNYLPDWSRRKPVTIGGLEDELFETMAFRVESLCVCGCGSPQHNGHELITQRYSTAREAREGHLAVCRKAANGEIKAETSGTEADLA